MSEPSPFGVGFFVPTMRPIAAVIMVLVVTAAPAQEMRTPQVRSVSIDWSEVRNLIVPELKSGLPTLHRRLSDRIASEQNPLGRLNQATNLVFSNIALSSVPVLLPFNVEAFLRDLAQGSKKGTEAYLAGFSVSKFFVPGPAGYDAAFTLNVRNAPALANLRYRGKREIQISGSSVIYELAEPSKSIGEPGPLEFRNKFPGLRKVLHENYLRFTFLRYGVPYVISISCSGSKEGLSCDEAEDILTYFLSALQVVGGTPAPNVKGFAPTLERPAKISKSFTYYSPGNLLDGTGEGRADYTVYAKIRFPIARAPAFANSQVFMNGGNCLGKSDPKKLKLGSVYRCLGRELQFFEGHNDNFRYPWRDNFCEKRDEHPVGQCPNILGHQGQDIRPGLPSRDVGSSGCKLDKKERCEPYQHDAVAVRNSYVWRSKEQDALTLIVNEPNEHIRFRYLHMLPQNMNRDGLFTEKTKFKRERDIVGKVGNYFGEPNGTSYHLHLDILVPTKDGWVFVNPYMTLVSAYEHLIGGKGKEIRALRSVGDFHAPPTPSKPSSLKDFIRSTDPSLN
jgi:hypothetical protein